MLNVFVVHVENKPGVLTRVASLFRRRAFNIDSLTVGRTEKPDVSRMTIDVDADKDGTRRLEASLYKLVNVLLVEDITDEPSINRDLAMIKVACTQETRTDILNLVNVFRARVVDLAMDSIIMEITGTKRRAPAFILLADWLVGQPLTALTRGLGTLLYLVYMLPLIGPFTRWTHVQLSVIAMAAAVYVIWQICRQGSANALTVITRMDTARIAET